MRIVIFLLTYITLLPLASAEESINYNALNKEGFGNVSEVLQAMTPEQRSQIMEEAKKIETELESYTPQEREALKKSLRHTSKKIPQHNIDPKSLDPKKFKGVEATKSDLKEYHKRYKK